MREKKVKASENEMKGREKKKNNVMDRDTDERKKKGKRVKM